MSNVSAPVKVDKSNIKDLLSSTDNFLFDCDGVLYRDKTAIEGTARVVNKLASMGKKILYVTNNSSKSRDQVAKKLTSFGFPAQTSSIICSAFVTASYLSEVKCGESVFVIGGEGLSEELKGHGLKVVTPMETFKSQSTADKLYEYEKDPKVTSVVVGLDENMTYLKVAQVMSYLYNTDLLFLSTNQDSTYPATNGKTFPGCGSLVVMVEKAAGRMVDVDCGKPGHVMADVMKRHHHINFSRSLMTGDRLDTDVAFANNNGMKSMLVLTGLSTPKTIASLTNTAPSTNPPPIVPHYYLPSLADLMDLL